MLEKWGAAAIVPFHTSLRITALSLALAGVVAFVAFMAHVVPLFPFIAILGLDFLFIVNVRHRVARIVEAVETPGTDLLVLKLLLERLEREQFTSLRLKAIRDRLQPAGLPASRPDRASGTLDRVARLERSCARARHPPGAFVEGTAGNGS